MQSIDRLRRIDPARLDGARYFESLLQAAAGAGLLAPEELEGIQVQLLALLAGQCEDFQLGESSSIRVEEADRILQSIAFLLGICCKAQPGPEEAVELLLRTPLRELHAQGRKLLRGKVHYAMHLYKRARSSRVETQLRAYHDTLRQEDGIGGFFPAYDMQFGAHEIPGTIDYPLCIPVEGPQGAEYIIDYLQHLVLENRFCAHFPPESIHLLLAGHHPRYPELLLNLFRQVYTGALCCALCGRPIRALFFTQVDMDAVQAAFSGHPEDIPPALRQADAAVRAELNIPQGDMQNYMARSLAGITRELATILKLGVPNYLFSPPALPVIQ